ncbi:MAG: ABC transporter ATP-binding protein [Coriobacteriales bacterium]|jgi:iron complex transport system ATP-binding protein|nr:ABC transporter ATP-binding protein [Coriobacteriales bacterium]
MRGHDPGVKRAAAVALATEQPSAIEYRGVGFSYDRRSFIESFDLSIVPGCVTGIIGPNGCGKSTLVKMAAGYLKPQAGEVLVDGRPTLGYRPKERARRLALLTQTGRCPSMTVEALVACGRYPHQSHQGSLDEAGRAVVMEAMSLCGVEMFRDHDVGLLSGGERQRAFVAMTIAQATSIIALDEPTTYLDVHACHDIMRLLRELKSADNKTILVILHDLDLALRYCDRIAVMSKGTLALEGTVDKVVASGVIEEVFKVRVQLNAPPAGSVNGVSYSLFPRF